MCVVRYAASLFLASTTSSTGGAGSGLTGLSLNHFVLVANARALVWLRFLDRANLSGDLADFLLVVTFDLKNIRNLRVLLDRHVFWRFKHRGMRETQVHRE